LTVCRSREDFIDKTAVLLSQIGDAVLSAALKQSTEIMVGKDERPYGHRIAALVDDMMTNESTSPAYAEPWRPGRRYAPSVWTSFANAGTNLLKRVTRRIAS
jgi:hypothetical protein